MKIAAIASFVIGVVALGTGAIGDRWSERTVKLGPGKSAIQRQSSATVSVSTFSAPLLTIVGSGALAAGVVFLLIDSSKRRP
jgi:hypothetical protein